MDEFARNIFYAAMLMDALGLAWLSFYRKQGTGRPEQWFFGLILAMHFSGVLLYTAARNKLPMDMPTQDTLIRTCGMSAVLVYVWTKYRDRLVAQTILIAQLMFFVAAFPMPLPSQMRFCPKLSIGIALPLSQLIYDFSVVIFAYCCSLSLAWFLRRHCSASNRQGPCSGPSLYDRIGDCALWGVAIFTVSHVVSSFGWLVQHGTYWVWNSHHLLFVAIWLFYVGMIHVKWVGGMSKRSLPILGITGFLGVLGFRLVFLL